MPVLYRKYRPQTFKEVVGQPVITRILQNQLKTVSFSHAYLFIGSRGVGKTSVARIFAKAVNCKKSGIEIKDACGECESCVAIKNGNYIDLVEIDAASNTGVDNIRELIEHIRFSPSQGEYKIFIIDEVHMLSKGAFNALLKTLEEPPKHAIFILATTEISKVPATIISRTQRFDFKRIEDSEILKYLAEISEKEGLGLNNEILNIVSVQSMGGLRDALSLLDKVATLGRNPETKMVYELLGLTDLEISEGLFQIIVNNQAFRIPDFFENLLERGVDFVILNRDFLEYLRKVLLIKISKDYTFTSLSLENNQKIKNNSISLSENEILLVIRFFLKSLKEQSFAPSPEIPFLLALTESVLKIAEKKLRLPPEVPNDNFSKNDILEEKQPVLSSKVILAESKQSLDTDLNITISEEDIFSKWEEVIEKIKEINGPLAHLLKNSKLKKLEGNKVLIEVKYKFHKQNFENSKNSEIINRVLLGVYKTNLFVSAEVEIKEDKENSIPSINDALKVFGGELVE